MNALEERKGENILLLDIHEIASFTDYFIICSGTSDRMLDALADAATTSAHQELGLRIHQEGQSSQGWLVVDAGDIVIHLMSPDQRAYYQLERLWEQGKILLRLQ